MGSSACTARARWLRRFFSPSASSAIVCLQPVDEEDRVVAEAAAASLPGDDLPRTDALDQVDLTRWGGQRHRAAEAGGPGRVVRSQQSEQCLAPIGIRALRAGQAGRVGPRGSVERVNLQPAVIPHGEQAGPAGGNDGLARGVLAVVRPLIDLLGEAHLVKGDQVQPREREQGPHLA